LNLENNDAEFFEIFPWSENFATGIEVIDEQHKQLISILNQLAGHLANRASSVKLNQIFDELAEYADYHFTTEEGVWRKYLHDDARYAAHENTHKMFIDKVVLLKQEEAQKPLDEVINDIVSFLSQWLAYHILDADKRMAKMVHAVQAGRSIEDARIQADDEMSGSMRVLIDTVLKMYDSLSNRSMALMREKALRRQAEAALWVSEERWKFILESGAENVWDWDIETGEVDYSDADTGIFEIVGLNKEEEQKKSPKIHPDDIAHVKAEIQSHLDGESNFFAIKYRILRENGGWYWALSRGKVVSRDQNGIAQRMIGTQSDVTARELAALIFQHSSQAMLVTDVNNEIISINPAFTAITGYQETELIGKNPRLLGSDKQDNEFYAALWDSVLDKGEWVGEVWNKRKNGAIFPAQLNINAVRDETGAINHYIGLFSDITDKKKADELIIEQANFDPLTKLPNRRMFQDRLQQEIRRSYRSGLPFALLYIDLDHFKEVNDTLGHEVGDQLLIEAAERISKLVRQIDTVSRIGGDEFTIIMPELHGSIGIDRITEKVIQELRQPFKLGVNQVYVSASVGITLYPNDADDATALLKHADQAMYLAKRRGRNGFSYFTPVMQYAAQKRQRILNDLRNALGRNQFELYYQPIVNLASSRIEKAEALIRWNHPEQGLIPPGEFISLAEESGLILDLGHWIYQQATQQIKHWQQRLQSTIQLSINVSPLQFKADNNIGKLLNCLDGQGLSTSSCLIEITEGLLMETGDDVVQQLLQLRDAGIEVALDDFGTGYSALAYIKKFHIDYIKIDKSFIDGLPQDTHDLVLCEAMVVMAHKMNIKVVAEGVETATQHKLLADMGCEYAQGYYYSRPLPAEEFECLLAQ